MNGGGEKREVVVEKEREVGGIKIDLKNNKNFVPN